MVYVWFVLAAAVTVFTARKLSRYADVISEKTAMGGMAVGTILLAGATSLPEVTTSFSAVMIDNIDIAIGNMVGSNLFNVFILGAFDLFYRKQQLFHLASRNHKYTASLGFILMMLVSLALMLRVDYTIAEIGVDALLIIIVYIVGMVVISKLPPPALHHEETADAQESSGDRESISVGHAFAGFVVSALIILGTGTLLSVTGDQIAVMTGMGSSFVGSFLIALTTSLPEGVSVLAALRLKNVNLAVGAILGSNMMNMLILALSDVVYREGSMLADGSRSLVLSVIGGMILVLVVIVALTRKRSQSEMTYSIPSKLIVIGYFIVQYMVFTS